MMKELLDRSKYATRIKSMDNKRFVYEDGVYISTAYIYSCNYY